MGRGTRKANVHSMQNPSEDPPKFNEPHPIVSPLVHGLLSQPVFVEDGVSFHSYRALHPLDPLLSIQYNPAASQPNDSLNAVLINMFLSRYRELSKSSKSMSFYFKGQYLF